MPTPQCLENIARRPPPGNHYCPGDLCARLQPDINRYCKSHNMEPNEPYATYDPNGNGKCYCCCDQAAAAATSMPVEVEEGLYRRADALEVGDRVLSTGTSLGGWTAREITGVAGFDPDPAFPTLLGEFRMENGHTRRIIASCDHLFLAGDGVLVPFARLRPGDVVRSADGGVATVEFTAWVRFSGTLRQVALGRYEGGALDGHLLNANGLVTADLGVQLAWASGALPASLVADGAAPALGSPEFHARYDSAAYATFVADPSRWGPLCEAIDAPDQPRGWA